MQHHQPSNLMKAKLVSSSMAKPELKSTDDLQAKKKRGTLPMNASRENIIQIDKEYVKVESVENNDEFFENINHLQNLYRDTFTHQDIDQDA